MKIEADALRKELEQIRDDLLVEVDRSEPALALVAINGEGVNHGVWQMFYRVTAALYRMETEELQAGQEVPA